MQVRGDRSTPIDKFSLRGLHPQSLEDRHEILALLKWVRRTRTVLHRGLNGAVDLETATVERIEGDELVLRAENFERRGSDQVFLGFLGAKRPYFFASERTAPFAGAELRIRVPSTIYYGERRDRMRREPDARRGDPLEVLVRANGLEAIPGCVENLSPGGLGLRVASPARSAEGVPLEVEFVDGRQAGLRSHLYVRHRQPDPSRPGWTRLGLCRAHGPAARPIAVEVREWILEPAWRAPVGETARGHRTGRARGEAERALRPEPQVVRYANRRGEPIVGLLDGWGEGRGATAVVLLNGWGQTKEALLPLARALVASFRRNAEAIRVLRYDGVRRSGESYNDPSCRLPGRENLHFVYSQAVEDIEASVDFLAELCTCTEHATLTERSPTECSIAERGSDEERRAANLVLVSVSASALEARRALARDVGQRIAGWISLVGSPDLQSMTRSISGGVDYAAGWERGLRFGYQELLGVAVDTNRMGTDAEAQHMIFIEDARRDMAEIAVPITWLHGQYDAWVDLARVRDILSYGNTKERRLITIPTGHRLKSSQQASEAFQLVAAEVSRIALGHTLAPAPADTRDVRLRRLAERRRLPTHTVNLHEFWHDYLVGRDGTLGIELLTSASAYRAMMAEQIRALALESGDHVADLGCGVGAFALQLARSPERPPGLHVVSIDYVRPALVRGRMRLRDHARKADLSVRHVEANLDLLHDARTAPLAGGRFDALIASLLLSYLERPQRVLAEMARLLRPGGRLVVSSLCRDADISRLWVESVAEFQVGTAGEDLPELESVDRSEMGRNFLNDAARILNFEEAGAFHFWEPRELEELVRQAGFTEVRSWRCLGSPSQAVVVAARRR